jgi:8-oxo-dGTP pyrophosphatase MutT (NUDIX family)
MTADEQAAVSTMSFEELWAQLWTGNCKSTKRMTEYVHAQTAHASLREVYDIAEMVREAPDHLSEREWTFPMGRRASVENDMDAAVREFSEETGFGADDIRIVENLSADEMYVGSNNVCYRQKYFVAEFIGDPAPLPIEKGSAQSSEIISVGWFSYGEARLKLATADRRRLFDDIHGKVVEKSRAGETHARFFCE